MKSQDDAGHSSNPSASKPSLSGDPLSDKLCQDQCDRWQQGERIRVESYLAQNLQLAGNPGALLDLIYNEIWLRVQHGEKPQREEYLRRFPQLTEGIQRQFEIHDALEASSGFAGELTTGMLPGPPKLTESALSTGPNPAPAEPEPAGLPQTTRAQQIRCPHCHNPLRLIAEQSEEVLCPGCGSSFRLHDARHTASTDLLHLGRFQLLDRVGLGAFGAVWRARDTELDRIVAIKIPHAGLSMSDTELQRFRDEARKVAQLRHPGIVAVHEVLTMQGPPAIVSDFISGVTLKDLLEVRRLTFREAALLAAEVAEALHYAHTRGLVHRDVKPANLMVESAAPAAGSASGTLGKPLILDFGLALREEATITLTVEGQIIGTPAYMSPEQAAGRGHRSDRRSDVFSLGVVLYELLCGELPFRGSRPMLLHQVQFEEPRPPRRINERIPRDLETICLKAMAKDPGRRYQSAADFAADLRRFLTGEPIHARPTGRVERLWRWCRRNPRTAALVGAVLTLLVVVAVGSSVAAIRIAHERNVATRARDEADAQRSRAEAHFAKVCKAMDMLTVAGEREVPQLERWQQELLEEVVRLYEDLAQETGTDAAVRLERAKAYRRVGEIRRIQGQHAAARQAFQEAIGQAAGLHGDFPTVAEYQHHLAIYHIDLGDLLRTMEQPVDQADEHNQAAIALETDLVGRFPNEPRYRQELARVHQNRGILLQLTKDRRAEALNEFLEAIRQLRQATAQQPAPELKADLARVYLNHGNLLKRSRDLPEAEKAYLAAIELLTQVVAPGVVPRDARYTLREYRYRLGITHINLSNLLGLLKGRDKDREKALVAAIALFARLRADFPGIVQYRTGLGHCYNSLGNLRADTGRPEQARGNYQQARELFQQLVDEFPRMTEFQHHLGQTLNNLSLLLLEQQARDERAQLVLLVLPDCHPCLGASPATWGCWLIPRERLLQVVPLLRQAIEAQRAALAPAPNNRSYQEDLRDCYWNLAETQARLGNHVETAAAARQLPNCLPDAWQEYRQAALYLARCANLAEIDSSLPRRTRGPQAQAYAQEAVRLLREAIARGFNDAPQLRADPAWQALRARPDFQELFVILEKKAPLP